MLTMALEMRVYCERWGWLLWQMGVVNMGDWVVTMGDGGYYGRKDWLPWEVKMVTSLVSADQLLWHLTQGSFI